MSEDRKPFTEYVTKAERGPGSSKLAWIAAGLPSAVL
jgi:hypothetical protein